MIQVYCIFCVNHHWTHPDSIDGELSLAHMHTYTSLTHTLRWVERKELTVNACFRHLSMCLRHIWTFLILVFFVYHTHSWINSAQKNFQLFLIYSYVYDQFCVVQWRIYSRIEHHFREYRVLCGLEKKFRYRIVVNFNWVCLSEEKKNDVSLISINKNTLCQAPQPQSMNTVYYRVHVLCVQETILNYFN